jgi:hypothetical protein
MDARTAVDVGAVVVVGAAVVVVAAAAVLLWCVRALRVERGQLGGAVAAAVHAQIKAELAPLRSLLSAALKRSHALPAGREDAPNRAAIAAPAAGPSTEHHAGPPPSGERPSSSGLPLPLAGTDAPALPVPSAAESPAAPDAPASRRLPTQRLDPLAVMGGPVWPFESAPSPQRPSVEPPPLVQPPPWVKEG